MIAKQTELENVQSIYEALDKSHLNFLPEKHELMSVHGINIPDHCGIIRNDTQTVLGVMGKDYTPFGPVQSMAIADTLRERFGLHYSKIVGIDNGRRIMLEMKGKYVKVGKDDIQETLQMVDSWDGSTKFMVRYGFFRLICKNGLTIGKIENQISIRHTKNAEARLTEALKIWAKAEIIFPKLQMKMQALANKVLDHVQVEKFLDELIGTNGDKVSTRKKNQKEDILHLYDHGKGNEGKTAWDLYNAATEYYEHNVNRENPDAALASALFGTSADQKSKAFDLAQTI